MANLRSKSTLGFFPTPARVAGAVARHLAAGATGARRVVRLLDPCVGEGDFAKTLSGALGTVGFGIELHAGRAAIARARLDHLLAVDALGGVRVGRQSFSILALNPPTTTTRRRGGWSTGSCRPRAYGYRATLAHGRELRC